MTSDETRTEKVLMHHLTAFGNNDLNDILKDYTEASEVLTPNGKLTGLVAIRSFFADFFQAIPTGSHFEMSQKVITGSIAYIVWTSESAVASIPMGTDTFVLEGDTIRYHTVADFRVYNQR